MQTTSVVAVVIVGVIHLIISMVEMFFWQVPTVYQRLGFTSDVARQVAPIVNNAGLYNGFLAVGLLWSAFSQNRSIRLFFLCCVVIAGLYGAVTLKPTTILLQTIPATIALITAWLTPSQLKQ